LGDGWLEQLHPDDRERWDAVYADALAERQTFSVEFRLRREDGVYRWMLATGNPTHSYLKTPFGQRMFDGFIGTCVDISEHKQSLASIQESQERLQRLNDRLRQSNQELKDFVYVASHDLQEPIRKIITFGERLRHSLSDTLPEAAQDNLGRIESAAYRMHQLINALLDYTRLTTKPQTFQPVNLGNILQEALSDLELAIEDKKASIEVGPLPAIEADPVQLRQLFQNLISNALKFSRPDEPPVISITCERIHGLEDAYRPYLHQPNQYFCALMVEDNGIGFEPQHAQKIFKAFQRLHSSSQYHGTGIGLAICRKIVERHGGAILADSLPMTYTRFVVLLPFQHEPSLDGLYSSTGIVSEAVSVGNGPRSKLSADLSSRLESVNPTAACRQDLRP
jgi:two-component system CheB/CheR fusion protein